MKNYAVAFGSLAICLAPNVVKADENLSVYAGIYGGLSLLTDNTVQIIDFVGGPVGQTFYLNYDAGVAAGGLVGVRLSENVRVGVELAYRSGALGELTSPGNIITDGYSFDTTAIALLGAVFVDLPVGASFTPYFGVGFGAARLTTSGSLERV